MVGKTPEEKKELQQMLQRNNRQAVQATIEWWMKRMIGLRKRSRAFGRGTFEFLHPSNRRVLAFLRRYQEECVLVVANLSRFAQHVELDLSRFGGMVPTEMLGHTPLPAIDPQRPYPLSPCKLRRKRLLR